MCVCTRAETDYSGFTIQISSSHYFMDILRIVTSTNLYFSTITTRSSANKRPFYSTDVNFSSLTLMCKADNKIFRILYPFETHYPEPHPCKIVANCFHMCLSVHIYICACAYACVCACMYACLCIHACVCVCVCDILQLNMYICTHKHKCKHAHAHVCACVCVCMYVCTLS